MLVFSAPSFSTSSTSKGTPDGTMPDDQASNAGDAPDANTAVADTPAQSNAKPDPQNVPQGLLCPNPAAGHRPEQGMALPKAERTSRAGSAASGRTMLVAWAMAKPSPGLCWAPTPSQASAWPATT